MLKEKFQSLKYKTFNMNNQTLTPSERIGQNPLQDRFFREKDEGLQHHKLFQNEAPENKYTKDCDTHYKVTYLLLQRDIKGNDVHKKAEGRLKQELKDMEKQKKEELREFNQQIENYRLNEIRKKENNRDNQRNNRIIWEDQMKARQEREEKASIEEKFAPVGTPQDYVKSHYQTMNVADSRCEVDRKKGKMIRINKTLQHPNLTFPKYYELSDEQPLYPFPLEDAGRAEIQ